MESVTEADPSYLLPKSSVSFTTAFGTFFLSYRISQKFPSTVTLVELNPSSSLEIEVGITVANYNYNCDYLSGGLHPDE